MSNTLPTDVTGYSASRDRVRAHRKRRRRGIHRRTLSIEDGQLEWLEDHGYLTERGDRDAEAAAVESFIADYMGVP